MLTMFKQIFTWWNHQTLGTRIYTFIFGKFKGKDYFGNKYYQSKSGKRWVIYNGEVDSSKIPNEWFSWIHFMKNKIENTQQLNKFEWQKKIFLIKPELLKHSILIKIMKMIIKNISLGKNKFFIIIFFLIFFFQKNYLNSDDKIYFGNNVDIKILDKLSSKNKLIKLEVGKNFKFKNLNLKVLKCKNSKFDDDPEITSYLQVKDLNNTDNNEVFVFNGWTFSSSPSIQVFDHPVYDLWILRCY